MIWCATSAAISFAINGIGIFSEMRALSPAGSFDMIDSGFGLFSVSISFFAPIIGVIFSLPFMLIRVSRHRGFVLFCVCVSFFGTFFLTMHLRESLRMRAFYSLAERSTPLIEAIGQFERDTGDPPETLEHLVPGYLTRVPSTEMGAYPDWGFLVTKDTGSWGENSWVISMEASKGLLNWDRFLYFPEQDYLESDGGGVYERVGNWAYYHE